MGFALIIAVLVGILAGGVVNALADDLPLRRSPRLPRYVSDDKKRAIHLPSIEDESQRDITQEEDEKRPLIAWLGITAFLLGKRVSPGDVKLTWRYPLAEFLTAALMVITVVALNRNDDLSEIGVLQATFWLAYMAIFALIIVIDIEHKLILFVVIIPTALLAVLDALLGEFWDSFYKPSLGEALIGGAVGFIVFFLLYNGGFLFTYVMGKLRGQDIKEIALGYGDVMLVTVSGLILGWRALVLALYITVFLGGLGAMFYLISRRLIGQTYRAFTALPYGPYIVAGTIIALLYRGPVSDLLLGG